MQDATAERQLTVLEASQLTGYSRETIYRAITLNRLKHIKRRIGRLVFYLIDRQSLEDYCKQNGRGAADGKPARQL